MSVVRRSGAISAPWRQSPLLVVAVAGCGGNSVGVGTAPTQVLRSGTSTMPPSSPSTTAPDPSTSTMPPTTTSSTSSTLGASRFFAQLGRSRSGRARVLRGMECWDEKSDASLRVGRAGSRGLSKSVSPMNPWYVGATRTQGHPMRCDCVHNRRAVFRVAAARRRQWRMACGLGSGLQCQRGRFVPPPCSGRSAPILATTTRTL